MVIVIVIGICIGISVCVGVSIGVGVVCKGSVDGVLIIILRGIWIRIDIIGIVINFNNIIIC